jgi:hypothetical protein
MDTERASPHTSAMPSDGEALVEEEWAGGAERQTPWGLWSSHDPPSRTGSHGPNGLSTCLTGQKHLWEPWNPDRHLA